MAAAMQQCCRAACMAASAPAVIFCKLSRRSRWARPFPAAWLQQSSECQHVMETSVVAPTNFWMSV